MLKQLIEKMRANHERDNIRTVHFKNGSSVEIPMKYLKQLFAEAPRGTVFYTVVVNNVMICAINMEEVVYID